MIRITKLLTIVALFTMAACEQADVQEPQILEENVSEFEEVEAYPIMIYDIISAKGQLSDCEAGLSSYSCDAIGNILEFAAESPLFVIPKRPRHCPMFIGGFKASLGGVVPRVPGTICDPDVCRNILAEGCLEGENNFKFAVKTASLESVSAYLVSEEGVLTGTDEEFGGSITQGLEFNSAQLNFGIPLPEIAQPGMVIIVKTVVSIDGELVKTSFKAEL